MSFTTEVILERLARRTPSVRPIEKLGMGLKSKYSTRALSPESPSVQLTVSMSVSSGE